MDEHEQYVVKALAKGDPKHIFYATDRGFLSFRSTIGGSIHAGGPFKLRLFETSHDAEAFINETLGATEMGNLTDFSAEPLTPIVEKLYGPSTLATSKNTLGR